MTSPEELNYGDRILLLRHGSEYEAGGIQFSAHEQLSVDQENVYEAVITSSPTYYGGFYDMTVRIDILKKETKLSIRRDLLIERTFEKTKRIAFSNDRSI